jgi:acetyl-CoA acetyltransferase
VTGVYIIGVGMTPFALRPQRSVKSLTTEALRGALGDAATPLTVVDAAFFANSGQGAMEGQHAIRGEIALHAAGLRDTPVINVENACAGGSTALQAAVTYVQAGRAEVALAVGAEKMSHPDRSRSFAVFAGGWDVAQSAESLALLLELGADVPVPEAHATGPSESVFMDIYASLIKDHMKRFGTTREDLAVVAAKNHRHAVHNPLAQYRVSMTEAEVLAARTVAWPLTVPMCAPLADGAAAVLVCSEDSVARFDPARAVHVAACEIGTGIDRGAEQYQEHLVVRTAWRAYEQAGLGPEDISVAEVHDATAFAEIWQSENLGLCDFGEGAALARSGATTLGGRLPINPSGGLESRGHPIGATGLAQVHEIVTQLRGEAAARQVEGARTGIIENGGGFIGYEEAVAAVTILERS